MPQSLEGARAAAAGADGSGSSSLALGTPKDGAATALLGRLGAVLALCSKMLSLGNSACLVSVQPGSGLLWFMLSAHSGASQGASQGATLLAQLREETAVHNPNLGSVAGEGNLECLNGQN